MLIHIRLCGTLQVGISAFNQSEIITGGVLRFGLDGGVKLKHRNPYPFLRVILAEKGIHCKGFFLQYRPIFDNCRKHPKILDQWTHVKGFFFFRKWEACLGSSCEKATH